jgi:hypothetical protein
VNLKTEIFCSDGFLAKLFVRAALLLLTLAHPALALPIAIDGQVFTDQYLYSGSGIGAGALAQSSLSVWLDADTKTEKGWGAKAIGEFDFFGKSMDHTYSASAFVQLREGYVSYFADGIDFRLGEQIIPWGKSDGINPTDYFTAKKYTFLNPDDEVRRVGAPAVNLNLTPDSGKSPFTAQFIFEPAYAQTELLIPSQLIPQGLTVNRNPSEAGPFGPQSMEYGIRLSFQKSNFDFSISAFKGFAAIPEFVFNPASGAVDSINAPEKAFGADASLTLGDYIIRFESAVHLPDNGTSEDPLFGYVEPDHWDSVVGIETPFLTDFRAQVQFLYRYHLYFRGSPTPNSDNPLVDSVMAGIARANATLLNYQHQGNPGASIRFAYAKDSSAWTGELFFVGYFADGSDYLIRPQVGYVPGENWKLLVGVDYYGGEVTRPLGALHELSDVFFEAKRVF